MTTTENAPVSVSEIAKMLQVSERTVHYDLTALGDYAKQNGKVIEKRAHKGIWLSQIEHEAVERKWGHETIMSPKDRRDILVYTLLTAKENLTLDLLAQIIDVSKSTLLTDMKEVQDFLQKRGIDYKSKRGQGIWLSGSELAIRDVLIHIFSHEIYNFRTFSHEERFATENGKLFKLYAGDMDIAGIADSFLQMAEEYNLSGSDVGINRMVVALAVQHRRMESGCYCGEYTLKYGMDNLLWDFAGKLAECIIQKDNCKMTGSEAAYLYEELLHSRLSITSIQEYDEAKVLKLARDFIADVEVWLGDIYQADDELLHGLALHLRPAIDRARFGISFTNPMLPDIQAEYQDLFEIAEKAAQRFSERTGVLFSPDEIGYLTIHLGAARERSRRKNKEKLSVALVCGSGRGTANLLAMTLEKHLPYLQIVKKISFYDADTQNMEGIDLILTTVPLSISNMPVLKVSPILREAEVRVVESQISGLFARKLARNDVKPKDKNNAIRLADILTSDLTIMDADIDSWQEAVRSAGRLLEKRDISTAGYTEQMVAAIEKFGPYMVIVSGVLMPHAGANDGAKKVGVSLLRLRKSIRVGLPDHGGPDNRPEVDLIFALATIDETSHVDVVQDLWNLFSDEEKLNQIRSAKDWHDVHQVLKSL